MSKFQGLSTAEKIHLAEELWDSVVDESATIEVTEWQKQVLNERLSTYRSDQEAGESWGNVKERILGK